MLKLDQSIIIFKLNFLFQMLILSRLMFALPAFDGFPALHDFASINAALKKAHRW